MVHGKENYMSGTKEVFAFIVGVVLVLMTLILCATYYSYNETLAMKSNIDSALVKGIDPLAVRCAYGKQSDTICVAYAVSHNKEMQVKK